MTPSSWQRAVTYRPLVKAFPVIIQYEPFLDAMASPAGVILCTHYEL